jgi:hypothetical protein
LAREEAAGQLGIFAAVAEPVTAPILLHGHCHQKRLPSVSPILM